jgi:ATP phosphoribosyltransferase regulatory subunit
LAILASGLLPEGLRDVLPPHADAEAGLLRMLIDQIALFGYARVSPPLIEFEDSLTQRMDSKQATALFRFMDPLSNQTLAIRSDITPQIARIAAHRLSSQPRPLRLCYGGMVVRAHGALLSPERQSLQVGAELIGADSVSAVLESLSVCLEALTQAGYQELSIDLTLPDLLDALLASHAPAPDRRALLQRLDAKDIAGLQQLGGQALEALITAAGPVHQALLKLKASPLNDALADSLSRVDAIATALQDSYPNVQVTLDPTEQHGFAYQKWIGFSVYAQGIRTEVGRGGAYRLRRADGAWESAVGFSLYLDSLLELDRPQTPKQIVFIPFGTPFVVLRQLHSQGMVTLQALHPNEAPGALCTHIWDKDNHKISNI